MNLPCNYSFLLQVSEFMLLNSNIGNPVITGSLVHNQRIECWWRDVFRCVLFVFYNLFYHLEEKGKLDPLSDVDLFCIHFVYHKINDALESLMNGWNSHSMTSEHGLTPVQLLTSGTLMAAVPLSQQPPSDSD